MLQYNVTELNENIKYNIYPKPGVNCTKSLSLVVRLLYYYTNNFSREQRQQAETTLLYEHWTEKFIVLDILAYIGCEICTIG